MLVVAKRFDRVMDRILFVKPSGDAEPAPQAETAQNALGLSLLFSGIRCTLQYAVLPFILPFVGLAADAALPVLLTLNVVAMLSVVLSLRRFWQIRYAHRWSYLFVAIVALSFLTLFLWMDVQALSEAIR